jgi:hypothetical protein
MEREFLRGISLCSEHLYLSSIVKTGLEALDMLEAFLAR